MPIVNYFRVLDCEHNTANKSEKLTESYKKDHWNGNRKPMKAYLYTNQFK